MIIEHAVTQADIIGTILMSWALINICWAIWNYDSFSSAIELIEWILIHPIKTCKNVFNYCKMSFIKR